MVEKVSYQIYANLQAATPTLTFSTNETRAAVDPNSQTNKLNSLTGVMLNKNWYNENKSGHQKYTGSNNHEMKIREW